MRFSVFDDKQLLTPVQQITLVKIFLHCADLDQSTHFYSQLLCRFFIAIQWKQFLCSLMTQNLDFVLCCDEILHSRSVKNLEACQCIFCCLWMWSRCHPHCLLTCKILVGNPFPHYFHVVFVVKECNIAKWGKKEIMSWFHLSNKLRYFLGLMMEGNPMSKYIVTFKFLGYLFPPKKLY